MIFTKKNNKIFAYYIFILIIFIFTGCASVKTKEPKQPDETFLADLEEFDIGDIALQTSINKGSAKITQIQLYCIPRTNCIAAYFKLGVNSAAVNFNYEERMSLKYAFDIYSEKYKNGSLQKNNINKKNAFTTGNAGVKWGVFGLTHVVNTNYYTTSYFLEKGKPYFAIKFESSQEHSENGQVADSPSFTVFLSPAQITKINELCSQQKLLDYVNRVYEDAYTFDSIVYDFEEESTERNILFDDKEDIDSDTSNFIDAK